MRETIPSRLGDYEKEALAMAAQIWPECKNKSEQIRTIINDWRRNRAPVLCASQPDALGKAAEAAEVTR